MKMQGRVIVLCDMFAVNMETSLVSKLFKDYGLSSEVLGIDLLNIFKNSCVSKLYLRSLLIDIVEMHRTLGEECMVQDVLNDLTTLLNEITKHMSDIQIKSSRLVNIQFQGRDTLILEYNKS
jgi:hypothetical protein